MPAHYDPKNLSPFMHKYCSDYPPLGPAKPTPRGVLVKNKSSLLKKKSRVYPKLEEQSVGGGDALPPCIPDAQQIRLPGGSPKPPVLSEKGLVDGAVSPEEPSKPVW